MRPRHSSHFDSPPTCLPPPQAAAETERDVAVADARAARREARDAAAAAAETEAALREQIRVANVASAAALRAREQSDAARADDLVALATRVEAAENAA